MELWFAALNCSIILNVLYHISMIVGPAERLALDRSWSRAIMMTNLGKLLVCRWPFTNTYSNQLPPCVKWRHKVIKACPLSTSVQIPRRAMRCSIVNGRIYLDPMSRAAKSRNGYGWFYINDIATSNNLLGLIGMVRSSSEPGADQHTISHDHVMWNLPSMFKFLILMRAFCTTLWLGTFSKRGQCSRRQ